MSIIKDRNIKDIIIVDNSIISFAFNLSNGVPIKAFLGNKNDEELLFMVTFLEELFSKDVRTHINSTFKLQEYTEKYARNGNRKHGANQSEIIRDAQESLFIKDVPDCQ